MPKEIRSDSRNEGRSIADVLKLNIFPEKDFDPIREVEGSVKVGGVVTKIGGITALESLLLMVESTKLSSSDDVRREEGVSGMGFGGRGPDELEVGGELIAMVREPGSRGFVIKLGEEAFRLTDLGGGGDRGSDVGGHPSIIWVESGGGARCWGRIMEVRCEGTSLLPLETSDGSSLLLLRLPPDAEGSFACDGSGKRGRLLLLNLRGDPSPFRFFSVIHTTALLLALQSAAARERLRSINTRFREKLPADGVVVVQVSAFEVVLEERVEGVGRRSVRGVGSGESDDGDGIRPENVGGAALGGRKREENLEEEGEGGRLFGLCNLLGGVGEKPKE